MLQTLVTYGNAQESPSSAHPPLQLRLAAPEEPGFFLERIPVRNLKEVWGVLEVRRITGYELVVY